MSVKYPDYPSLKLDWPIERVLRITMSRGKMNSMDFDLHHGLVDIFARIDDDRDVNAVILTGEGKTFSAGGDFGLVDKVVNDPDFRATMWKDGVRLVRNMIDCSKLVISAINGAVAGGGLAAAMRATSPSRRVQPKSLTAIHGSAWRRAITPPSSGRCCAAWPRQNTI